MKVALYLRRSTTDLQHESLVVQEELLRDYARRREMTITRVYRDSSSGTTVVGRDEFQKLIADAVRGPEFEAVVVRDVSRFGRFFNIDEAAYWEFLLHTHGVRTIYAEESFDHDHSPMAGLLKNIKRVLASEGSREKSRLVTAAQIHTTRQGFFTSGAPPYGMKRILVTREGDYLQDLAPGERKALGHVKTKLAPGDPDQVDTVRWIFHSFLSGSDIKAITRDLTSKGVRSPSGLGWWHPSSVKHILRNPVYAGYSQYRLRKRPVAGLLAQAASEIAPVRTSDAYDAIVPHTVWTQAQDKLDMFVRNRSDDDLVADIRKGFELNGCIRADMLTGIRGAARMGTYRLRFKGDYHEALCRAYADEILAVKTVITDLLHGEFDVEETDLGWRIDDLLDLRFAVGLPRSKDRNRRVKWEFRSADWQEHSVLGLGFMPGKDFQLGDLMIFDRCRGAFPSKLRYVPVAVNDDRKRVRIRSAHHLFFSIRHAMYLYNPEAERRFRAAALDSPVINLSALSRSLNFPPQVVTKLYHRAKDEGVDLPPLQKEHGRRLDVVCSVCGHRRKLHPSRAFELRGDRCLDCERSKGQNKVEITCPTCGHRRMVWPSTVRKMKGGANALCHECALKKGRETRRWYVEKQRAERAALLAVMDEIVEEMKTQPERFERPAVWHRNGRQFPLVAWKQDGQRKVLLVKQGEKLQPLIERLDETQWVRRSSRNRKLDEVWELVL